MAESSSIEWTHHTFNPWRGCAKVHPGCTHCYAEKNVGVSLAGIRWGEVWQGGQRVVKADSGWREPVRWARDAARAGERRRVFCASLSDVLEVPEMPPFSQLTTDLRVRVTRARHVLHGARQRLWEVIRETSSVCGRCSYPEARHVERHHCAGTPRPLAPVGGLDWLLLTKRPENWELIPEDVAALAWLGTSISDQRTADEWVPRLLQAQGFRLRFLSVEPLVGPVDLEAFLSQYDRHGEPSGPRCNPDGSSAIGWVIVGGESGPKARPCNVRWVRDVVDQCREAGGPCFVKQLGSAYEDPENGVAGAGRKVPHDARELVRSRLQDAKGGDMSEWPEDLRVRELPEVPHG